MAHVYGYPGNVEQQARQADVAIIVGDFGYYRCRLDVILLIDLSVGLTVRWTDVGRRLLSRIFIVSSNEFRCSLLYCLIVSRYLPCVFQTYA